MTATDTVVSVSTDNSKLLAAIEELAEIRASKPEIPPEAFESVLDSLVKGLSFAGVQHSASGASELCVVIEVPDSHLERVAALRAGQIQVGSPVNH